MDFKKLSTALKFKFKWKFETNFHIDNLKIDLFASKGEAKVAFIVFEDNQNINEISKKLLKNGILMFGFVSKEKFENLKNQVELEMLLIPVENNIILNESLNQYNVINIEDYINLVFTEGQKAYDLAMIF